MSTDSPTILTRLAEILESLPTVQKYVPKLAALSGDTKDYYNIQLQRFYPTGNQFPVIAIKYVANASEEIINAEHGILTIIIWYQKGEPEDAFGEMYEMATEIKDTINRNVNEPFNQFRTDGDDYVSGLRVNKCTKTNEDHDFDQSVEKPFYTLVFNIVKSDNENFNNDYGPDADDNWP
jgi:hypothetical protein